MTVDCVGSHVVTEGALTLSACDSTVSKYFREGQKQFIPKLLRPSMDGSFGSLGARTMDYDDSCTPFKSQLSTLCSKFKGSSTLTSRPDAPSTPVNVPMISTAAGVHPKTTVVEMATAATEKVEVLTESEQVTHVENKEEDVVADAEDSGLHKYTAFLDVEKEDPLMQVDSGHVQLLPSYNIRDDVDVVLPAQV